MRTWLFHFKTRFNQYYIVTAEQYDYDLFVLKFYNRSDKLSPNKYNVLYNHNDCWRIFGTCLEIAQYILDKVPHASFGFMGEPTLDEKERGPEHERDFTKRFKLYRQYAADFFSKERWDHLEAYIISGYLLFNQLNTTKNLQKKTINMLKDIFPSLESLD